jgi:MraZ protein
MVVLESGLKWSKMEDRLKGMSDKDQKGEYLTSSNVVSQASPSFYGSYEHVIDAKGRVALPSSFRSLLKPEDDNSVVLTNFITEGVRCLDGFSLSAWREFEHTLRERGRFNPSVRKLETFYFSRAAHCTCDSNGRINIPSHLREYAGIEKDLVFTASLHGFRVWRKEVWNMVFAQAEEMLLEDPSLFEGIDS